MKINLTLILSIIISVGLVALGFTAFQISSERQELKAELEANTVSLADDFYRLHLQDTKDSTGFRMKTVTDSIISQYSFSGVAVHYNNDSIVALNPAAKKYVERSNDFTAQAISADSSMGNFLSVKGDKLYQYIKVIKRQGLPSSAVIFYTDAGYISNIINSIWLRNFIRWFLQAFLISIVTLLIVRWGVLSPLRKVVEWVQAARSGNVEQLKKRPSITFLEPLYREITGIAQAMHEAKAIAQEEAR